MKKLTGLALILAASLAIIGPDLAYADTCSSKARQFVAGKPRMALLSVRSEGSGANLVCIARVRVASKNGEPPRIVERRFRP